MSEPGLMGFMGLFGFKWYCRSLDLEYILSSKSQKSYKSRFRHLRSNILVMRLSNPLH
jgi:hypothetical protein